MKIIDLLIKINNFNNGKNESLPNKIKFYDKYYIWYDNEYTENEGYCLEPLKADSNSFLEINTVYDLNKEVEIIKEDKEIEKLDIMSDEATPNSYYILNEHGTKCYLTKHSKVIADRVNLLIDKVNSLEKKQ